jgi:sulfotransferase
LDNTIHLISGLPRAGSTLLLATLRQNPAFSASMTSVVGVLHIALETAMSGEQTAVFLDAGQRQDVLHGVFTSYYHDAGRLRLI